MKGKIFLILGPSGSGKGTVIAYLKKHFSDFMFPVSCTTRPPRPGERDGEIYSFIDKEEFQKKIEAGEFLEWAIVHADNFYGTLRKPIMQALEAGQYVLREVDMQGVESIFEMLPKGQVVSIFITTKSWDDLKKRILSRHPESDEELFKRHESYKKEMEFSRECNYIVRNETGKVQECIDRVVGIIEKEM